MITCRATMKTMLGAIAACLLAPVVSAVAQEAQPEQREGESAQREDDASEREDSSSRRERRRSGGSREDRSAEPDPFRDAYAVLLDNNIFLRDRRPPRAPTTGPTTREAPPPAEKSWMLVGIVFEEGVFRAYFENLRDNAVTRAAPGEAIANGAVAEVYIDAIAYAHDGQVHWIEIGQDLTGAFPEGLVTQRAPTAAAPAGRTGAPAAPTAQTLSIEERLRQRRLQESGGATIQLQVGPGGELRKVPPGAVPAERSRPPDEPEPQDPDDPEPRDPDDPPPEEPGDPDRRQP